MKLIIDIDDKCFDFISHFGIQDTKEIEDIIANGTPLPKGHGDLIDSSVLCEQYEKTYGDLYQALDLTPSIIEADKGE